MSGSTFSSHDLALGDRLVQIHDLIRAHLRTLTEILQASECQQAHVFALGIPVMNSAGDPAHVPVTPLDGQPAFESACLAYQRLYATEEQARLSTKEVFRLPGCIVMQASHPDEVALLVEKINALKAEYSNVAGEFSSVDHRYRIEHALMPYLIHPQVTRKIHLLNQPSKLYSVTFTWGKKPSVAKAGTKERIRRELRHRPLVNLRYNTTPVQKKQVEGHTPLLILNPEAAIKIGRLKPYQEKHRKTRTDASPWTSSPPSAVGCR